MSLSTYLKSLIDRRSSPVPDDPTGPPTIADVLRNFESLGRNCEFGLVQKFSGLPSPSLFKFSGTTPDTLAAALDADLADYGTGDDLELFAHDSGYLFCRSRRYDCPYNTGDLTEAADPIAVLARQVRKVAYLKRHFLEELAGGDKILVLTGVPEEHRDRVVRLSRALRRHGPCPLLWVKEAGHPFVPSPVRWAEEGIMEGFVPRFAPPERALDVDLPNWLRVCLSACALTHRQPSALLLSQRNLIGRRAPSFGRHRLATDGRSVDHFRIAQALAGLNRRAVHAFSAWVWVPAAFGGARIGAVIGQHRIRWQDADLARRECWQRVWVTANLPEDRDHLRIGLVAQAPDRDRFQSSGWRLEEAPWPPDADTPPTRRPGFGLRRSSGSPRA